MALLLMSMNLGAFDSYIYIHELLREVSNSAGIRMSSYNVFFKR